MKKKTSIKLIAGLTMLSAMAAATATAAWIIPMASVGKEKNPIEATTQGAYFAYGNGKLPTESEPNNRPYGITVPRHLYNFAWLQYLGFFNKPDGQQVYFELADDIDMSEWVLPPIGSAANPFVGNFNGNGHVVSGLTVSDQFSDYDYHPYDVTSSNYVQPQIVGFFGIVGNLDSAYSGTYVTSTNSLYDFGIDGFTIETSASSTLAGMVAGYVDAELKNIAVNASSIDIKASNATYFKKTWTENLSDYGTVGYVTPEYKKSITKYDQTLYDVNVALNKEFNATDDGDSEGWGGSINMKTIYNRIVSLRKTKSTDVSSNGNSTANWRIDKIYYDDTEATSEGTNHNAVGTSQPQSGGQYYNDAYSRYNGFNESGHEYIGSYNVYARAVSYGWGSDKDTYGDQQYLYLSGGHYENNVYNKYYEHTGYVISNGTYYLNQNNGSIARGSSLSDATRWSFRIGTSMIYTSYSGRTYYLRNNNGTLTITDSSSNATNWSISESGGKFIISNGNYYLNYANNAWTLSSVPGLYITDGTNYLRYNGSLGNTTTASSASTWSYSEGTSVYISTTYNNTTYYLRNNNGTLTTTNNTNNRTAWTVSLNNNGNYDIYNGNYHLTYDSGWKLVQDTGEEYYTIRDGSNHYIGPASSYSATSTNESGAAHFLYGVSTQSASNGQTGFYYLSGTSQYFLGFYSTGTYGVQTWSDSKYLYNLEGVDLPNSSNPTVTGKMVCTNTSNNTPYYITYNGSSPAWKDTTSSSSATTLTVSYVNTRTFVPVINQVTPSISSVINSTTETTKKGDDYYEDTATSTANSRMYYTATDTTYLPLNVGKDLNSYISNASNLNTEISSGNLDPKDSNTGYIVSGSAVTSSTTTFSGPTHSNIRVSRYAITKVSTSYSKSSGETTTISDLSDSKIYTFNTSGGSTNMGAVDTTSATTLYPRFADSKTAFFQNSLSTGTTTQSGTTYKANAYVYGLHFMSATINSNHIVNASKVGLLGNKYDTYQMPVNSVNFNLKQKGVVNFFAGSYFTDNNSFFSLHQIIRNDDAVLKSGSEDDYTSGPTISQIKEISEIYSVDKGSTTTKYSNIYKYSDGTYSKPYRFDGNQNKFEMNKNSTTDSTTPYTEDYSMNSSDFNSYVSTYGYTLRFNTTNQIGIKTLTDNAIYYFEFPMNSGEYCLGSVNNGTGAYLLYLDIGANAAKTQRTVVYEHFKEIKKTFYCPVGVALVPTTKVAENIANNQDLDESDTANVVIYAGYKGVLTITRTTDEATLTRASGFTANAKPTLIGEQMWDDSHQQYNIHDPGGTNISNEIQSVNVTTETRRLTYYDYNVNLGELTVTSFTDESTDGGSTYTRTYIVQSVYNSDVVSETPTITYTYDPNAETPVDQRASMKVYNHSNNGIKYDVADLINTTLISTADVSNTVILNVIYTNENDEDTETLRTLTLKVDTTNTTGKYYIYQDYVFTIEVTEGSVVINVVTKGSETIYISDGTNQTEVTAAGQTITLPISNP